MFEWYKTNLDLSSKIIKEKCGIKCKYKYTGANFMITIMWSQNNMFIMTLMIQEDHLKTT